MKIERIDVFVIKVDQHDRFGAHTDSPNTLGKTSYTNRIVTPALDVDGGEIMVPSGAGFGVSIDEGRLSTEVSHHWSITA
jgi:L-alanine-DL-glutamate epimerase-like enolase superfamily enzyme